MVVDLNKDQCTILVRSDAGNEMLERGGPLRRLPSGHRTVRVEAFEHGSWSLPPELAAAVLNHHGENPFVVDSRSERC